MIERLNAGRIVSLSFSPLQTIRLPPIAVYFFHHIIGLTGRTYFSLFTRRIIPVQAISYLVDIYHERLAAERSFVRVGLYLALFPKIIAGPITKYGSLLPEFIHRRLSSENMADGAKRFIVGLAKKVIVADTLGVPVASIFGLPPERLTTELAWFGICCYTLQIYFDFSGYTDMAIGLGRMFGLHLPENFRYPYASQSIREFWRRWHITLSQWFRDYVYIPLGGSRCTPLRIYTNLFTVFFLCGLWHGAGWNFVIWGMLHGTLMVVERLGLEQVLQKVPRAMRWMYAMGSVTIAWVFFRCDTLSHAMNFLAAMFGMGRGDATAYQLGIYLSTKLLLAFAVGVLGSLPLVPLLKARIERTGWTAVRVGVPMVETALYVCMLFGGMMYVASGTFRPFVYAQF